MSNAEAGHLLGMPEATVEAHVSGILRELGLANLVQARFSPMCGLGVRR
jgi:DNA-binding NarL/FixJ family response regulator